MEHSCSTPESQDYEMMHKDETWKESGGPSSRICCLRFPVVSSIIMASPGFSGGLGVPRTPWPQSRDQVNLNPRLLLRTEPSQVPTPTACLSSPTEWTTRTRLKPPSCQLTRSPWRSFLNDRNVGTNLNSPLYDPHHFLSIMHGLVFIAA